MIVTVNLSKLLQEQKITQGEHDKLLALAGLIAIGLTFGIRRYNMHMRRWQDTETWRRSSRRA